MSLTNANEPLSGGKAEAGVQFVGSRFARFAVHPNQQRLAGADSRARRKSPASQVGECVA